MDYLKAARWLIPQEEVSDFEYVYIGDVDFIICREDPDIRARHVGHCRQNDLPYSNAVRVKDPPVRRLSGLHFIIVKPYYEKMASAMAEMRERILSGAFSDAPIVGNEFLLYEMVDRGIGRFPSLFYRPGHGLHLGVLADPNYSGNASAARVAQVDSTAWPSLRYHGPPWRRRMIETGRGSCAARKWTQGAQEQHPIPVSQTHL